MTPQLPVVGIDVAKKKLDVVYIDATRQDYRTFTNSPAGFEDLQQWLTQRTTEPVTVCLEATNIYSDAVAAYLHTCDHRVSMVNPAQIKAYARAQLSRNKTDKGDAWLIARFAQRHALPQWTPPDPAWLELRALVRHLETLKALVQQQRNRLDSATTPAVARSLQTHIDFLLAEIEHFKQQLHDHLDQHPDLKRNHDLLTSIPGIGSWTALFVLAEIPDIRQFASAKALVAFAGLNPRQKQSGSSTCAYTPISKVGSARLRKALFMPALVAKRHNPIVRAFCARLLDNGKLPMVTVVAAMRKLLHLIFGILKHQRPFDPKFASTA